MSYRLWWPHSMPWLIFSHVKAQTTSCSIPHPMSPTKCLKQFIRFVQWQILHEFSLCQFCLFPFFRSFTSHYYNFTCTTFFLYFTSLIRTEYFIWQTYTAICYCRQYESPSLQTISSQFHSDSHVPQDYCIVNGTTMISAWVTVILLPSR